MKKMTVKLFVAGLVVGLVGFAQAQMVGLPIMDTAAPRDAGNLEFIPGAVFGQDMNVYGARLGVNVKDDFRLFFDVGQVSVNDGDANFGFQGGGLYALPENDFIDLGIRGALYSANTDGLGLNGINVMMVFSDETIFDHLYFYSGVGLDGVYKSIDDAYGVNTDDHIELNPAFAAGLSYQLSETFSLFAEADFIDGMYCAFGLSIR